MKLVAITGGIGSGKSVVSRILRTMGYNVYDTDSEAKHIMATSTAIKQSITDEFGADTLDEKGNIVSANLAKAVFNNHAKLDTLNRIVHPAVIADVLRWAQELSDTICFVETAILYESGLSEKVDSYWLVKAPIDVRIERVMRRSSLTEEQVRSRIASQSTLLDANANYVINNDGIEPLLPQIIEGLKIILDVEV